jgi:biopolymer transport protein ExbB
MRTRHFDQIFLALMITIFFFLCLPATSSAWWNESWGYRKKITLDISPSGADVTANLTEATVLVRLHSGNFNFTNAGSNGGDLRFVDSSDARVLEHHIESYSSLEEMGFVWVKIPVLPGGASQHIWIYYGNPKAGSIIGTGESFDVNHVAVFHFGESEGPPQDASAYNNHASTYSLGQGFPSVAGLGVMLNGFGDNLEISSSPSLDFSGGLTFSAWIKLSGQVSDGYLFADKGGDNFVIGIDGTTIYARLTDAAGQLITTERVAQVPNGSWQYIAVTVDPDSRLSIYINGGLVDSAPINSRLATIKNNLIIGSSGQGSHFFAGEMDEVRISKVPRSGEWLRAMYFSQGPEQGFLSLGIEEVGKVGGSVPIFFLGTIFENITLDGLFIIAILLLLGILSMIVLMNKILLLKYTQRENQEFMDAFNKTYDDPVCVYLGDMDFQNSTLYSIYSEGCKDLMGWMDHLEANGFEQSMMARAVKSMKSALDRRYLQESQKLNAWLVVLTLAISGGPFLGLLGTVWGVMNTFAAMAIAGEANLMAIAPGVASALSTTVFGLIVAIPALFGYNYLLSKIKNITAEMNIFADQFAMRVEEMIYKG